MPRPGGVPAERPAGAGRRASGTSRASPTAATAGAEAAPPEPAPAGPTGTDPPAPEAGAEVDPDAEPEPPPEVLEIGDGLHVLPYCGNATLRVTPRGVVLVGDRLPQYRAEIARLLATVTEQGIAYELRTRPAEAVDAAPVAPGARRLAPARTGAAGESGQPETAADIDFTTRLSLFPGGVEVRMHHLGPGRAGGAAAVVFPDRAAVHAGELVTAGPPLIDYAGGGSIDDWIEALNALLALEFDTVIPGDGPVLSRRDAQGFRDRLVTLRTRVLQLVRRRGRTGARRGSPADRRSGVAARPGRSLRPRDPPRPLRRGGGRPVRRAALGSGAVLGSGALLRSDALLRSGPEAPSAATG